MKLLAVEDHEIARAGLSSVVAGDPEIHLLGMAADGLEALRLIEELRPEVVLVDYRLPRMSGTQLCEEIVIRYPEAAVLMLTVYLDDDIVRSAVEAGARGFLSKDVAAADLRRAIKSLARGDAVLDPKVAGRVMRRMKGTRLDRERALSPREVEVLRLVARGATNPEIARTLHLSSNTVKTYLQRSLRKLGCQRRTEAAAVATRWGLL